MIYAHYSLLRYLTHGSWSLLWPVQLLILRIQKRKLVWPAFWKRHVYLVRTTAQMVESHDLHLTSRESHKSPVPYMIKTTAFVTTALTVAGGSWYVAVNMTSASDLTAIYNCSAFFAYAFSIPLLNDKFRFDKAFSVFVAIAGVLIVAYGDSAPTKHGGKSGGSVGGGPADKAKEAPSRTLGNLVIGVGSVLYGLYEVLYKKYACPPEGTSPGRGMIFANTFGSLIGTFTLCVLWIPLPILHFTGLETFELPKGEAAWMMAISVLANASKCSPRAFQASNILTPHPQLSPVPSSCSSPSRPRCSPPSPPSSPSSSLQLSTGSLRASLYLLLR
jgi:drug/metabolite transporter (DMT)-like permease